MVWRAWGRKRTSVNTVIKYTYSLHRCSDGCTAHVNSLMKNRPVWPNIHRLMQFLRSATACGLEKRPGCKCCKNKNRSVARCRHETVSIYISFFFLPPLPNKRQNRKLSGSLLSTVNFYFYPASSYPTGRRCLRLFSSREPAHSEYQLNVSVSAAVSRRDTSP